MDSVDQLFKNKEVFVYSSDSCSNKNTIICCFSQCLTRSFESRIYVIYVE